jgi:cytochrome b561
MFKYAPVECSPLEKFAIKEFGYRFIIHYELAFVACFIIKMIGKDSRKQSELRRFHWSLGVSSMLTTLFFAYMQVYGPAPLDDSLFARMVFYRLIAIVISWHSYVTGPSLEKESPAAWSVPGASIMIGMVRSLIRRGNKYFN